MKVKVFIEDGDLCALTVNYSDESIEEINKKLQSRSYYVESGGKLAFSLSTDTTNYLVQNLTGNPE